MQVRGLNGREGGSVFPYAACRDLRCPHRRRPAVRPSTARLHVGEDNEYAVARRRWDEQERRDRPRREAEWRAEREARFAEAERRAEEKRQRRLAAGGIESLDQLQSDAFYAGRCGWYEDGDTEVCLRPTDESFVWCKKHNRQLDREAEQRRRERASFDVIPHPYDSRGGNEHV
jgi:hypothetical protein